MKITPKKYLHTFTLIVFALGIIRLTTNIDGSRITDDSTPSQDTLLTTIPESEPLKVIENAEQPHPIYSVPNYDKAFPDLNDVQLESAKSLGVKPAANREEAANRKDELVYVGASPYFHVERLSSSIPYLVPKASDLFNEIGKVYFDSLRVKGIPLHKIIATSVLRSKSDVEKLRTHNPNATENSCHMYGTTFDIAQNRFITVEDPEGQPRRQVTNDTLKWVLAEVLNDMRNHGKCLVKYEKKRGCFHITVKK